MNPFIVGQRVAPEHFIGQKTLIRTAFTQIRNRSSLAIWGGTGMGKSSFLELLTSPIIWQKYGLDSTQAIIVLFDCQSIEPFKAYEFWHNILEEIKNNFPILKIDIDTFLEQGKNTNNNMGNILRGLGDPNKYLVLLIDNYDVALRPNSQHTEADIEAFVSQCRTIANPDLRRQYMSMIVTSSRRLSEIGFRITPDKSPWYNHYPFRHLKPFTDEEVDILLAKSENLLAWKEAIRKIADGNPALLQNACYLLYEELCSGNILNPQTFIQEFKTATLHLFQVIWDLSTETEQTLLMLLALFTLEGRLGKNRYAIGGIEGILSRKQIEINNLVERGILKEVKREEKINYAFCSSIMEWWVIKQIENSQQEDLNKRQKVFVNLMSREQLRRVNAAISWIWQNKDKIASTVEQAGNFL